MLHMQSDCIKLVVLCCATREGWLCYTVLHVKAGCVILCYSHRLIVLSYTVLLTQADCVKLHCATHSG